MARTQKQIDERIQSLNEELENLTTQAERKVSTPWPTSVSFRYEISAPRDVLTTFERAQSLCFVTKYDSLPPLEDLDVREHNGKYYPNNIDAYRHLLNEYRPIIQNVKDSTHFSRIHSFCRQKLKNTDPSRDLRITALAKDQSDITDQVLNHLDETNRSISWIIKNLEFGYIYNGILQHAEHAFTNRYVSEYASGELHYVFIRHAIAADYIGKSLRKHYRLLKVLSGAIMGPM